MYIPIIQTEGRIKSGWIGDDIELQPKIKITKMEQIPNSITGGSSGLSGTWYDRHGLPNPDNAAQIVEHRERKEKQRLADREEDFWKEIESRIKFTTTVEEVKELEYDPAFNQQCVQNFGDVKIGFK